MAIYAQTDVTSVLTWHFFFFPSFSFFNSDLTLTVLLFTPVGTLSNSSTVCFRFSLNSELHNHSLVTVIGGEEEHFEDFGESNTSELLLESTTEGPEGEGDSHLTQTPEQVNGSALRSPRYELVFPTQLNSGFPKFKLFVVQVISNFNPKSVDLRSH